MAQCKAITENGVQCKREARDGLEFCAIPAHAEQETMRTDELNFSVKDAYKIFICVVGEKAIPDVAFSGRQVLDILNMYNAQGYDVFSTHSHLKSGVAQASGDYFAMIYTLKLRE